MRFDRYCRWVLFGPPARVASTMSYVASCADGSGGCLGRSAGCRDSHRRSARRGNFGGWNCLRFFFTLKAVVRLRHSVLRAGNLFPFRQVWISSWERRRSLAEPRRSVDLTGHSHSTRSWRSPASTEDVEIYKRRGVITNLTLTIARRALSSIRVHTPSGAKFWTCATEGITDLTSGNSLNISYFRADSLPLNHHP
jgi:hypothetical protein